MISVVTATYNRAYVLPRLYKSLKNQTSQNFEWIIVDDESSDDTESLVISFSCVGKEIVYHKQKHGGKHRAVNWAVNKAEGDFIFLVDSDDYLVPNAIELIESWTQDLDHYPDICGVAGLKISLDGTIWGGKPQFNQEEYVLASNLERKVYNLDGDKAEVYSTSILRRFPFPEHDGEFFVTEAVVWDAIAEAGYKLRWYNVPIYVCEYLEDGLTKSGVNSWEGHINNYYGFCDYVSIYLRTRKGIDRVLLFTTYDAVSNYLKIDFQKKAKNINFSFESYFIFQIKSTIYKIKSKVQRLLKKLQSNQ